MKKHIQKLETAVTERRERLNKMNPRPEGTSVQPLLDSCQKHLEVQEKVWLPEMKKVLELMEKEEPGAEKGQPGVLLKITILGAMKRCMGAENEAMKDLTEKFDAYRKEFEAELKKSGRIQ